MICNDSHILCIISCNHYTVQMTNSRGRLHSHCRCRSRCSYNFYRLQAQDLQLHNSHVHNLRFSRSKGKEVKELLVQFPLYNYWYSVHYINHNRCLLLDSRSHIRTFSNNCYCHKHHCFYHLKTW